MSVLALSVNYSALTPKEPSVTQLKKLFNRAASNVITIDVDPSVKTSSGIKYKELQFGFVDSQQVVFQVKATGDVFSVKLNGKALPIKHQDNEAKAVIEIIDAMDAGRAKFQANQARTVIKPPAMKTSTVSIEQQLTEQRDELKAQIAQVRADIGKAQAEQAEKAKAVATALHPIELTGKELGDFPGTEEGKKALLLKAVEHFRGVLEKKDGIFNPALDKWVKFNGTARDKVAQFSKDERKLLVVAKLDGIVANGKPTPISPVEPHDKAKRKGVVKTHILKTGVSIKGEILKIRFLIHEMKNGNFFYDHSVDREEFSKALGGNAVARNSADAAGLNNSALLQDEPSSQQRLTVDNLPNTLDSVNSKMVFNIFIEGEEPEYVEDDGEEEAKEIAVELTGFTKLENGSYVSNRAVDYTKLSVGRLNKLLTKDTLTKSDVEDLKDYKFMMLFDKQAAIEKGFLIAVGDKGSYTPKNAHWITNIDNKIKESGGNPQDLVNNPIALSALAVVSKGEEPAVESAISENSESLQELPIQISPDDIPYQAAYDAYRGISFSPEKRAKDTQVGYVKDMTTIWGDAVKKANGDKDELQRMASEFIGFVSGYKAKLLAQLSAKSRTLSPMITGGSNFPVAANQKKNETERKRSEELVDYYNRGVKRIMENPLPTVDKSASGTLARLDAELERAKKEHDAIKKASAMLRKNDIEGIKNLAREYYPNPSKEELKTIDSMLNPHSYTLTYANKRVKDIESKLAIAKKRNEAVQNIESGDAEIPEYAFLDGTIIESAEDDRIRLIFNSRPSSEVVAALKKNAFKWSPSNGAWQRQLTMNAKVAARSLIRQLNLSVPYDPKNPYSTKNLGLG